MNKFKMIMAALLLATAVTACSSDEPAAANVTVVEDGDANVPSNTADMNDEENVDQNNEAN